MLALLDCLIVIFLVLISYIFLLYVIRDTGFYLNLLLHHIFTVKHTIMVYFSGLQL